MANQVVGQLTIQDGGESITSATVDEQLFNDNFTIGLDGTVTAVANIDFDVTPWASPQTFTLNATNIIGTTSETFTITVTNDTADDVGVELVQDPSFDDPLAWTVINGEVSGGTLTLSNSFGGGDYVALTELLNTIPTSVLYEVVITVSQISGTNTAYTLDLYIGNYANNTEYSEALPQLVVGVNTIQFTSHATQVISGIAIRSNASPSDTNTLVLTDISVKRI